MKRKHKYKTFQLWLGEVLGQAFKYSKMGQRTKKQQITQQKKEKGKKAITEELFQKNFRLFPVGRNHQLCAELVCRCEVVHDKQRTLACRTARRTLATEMRPMRLGIWDLGNGKWEMK